LAQQRAAVEEPPIGDIQQAINDYADAHLRSFELSEAAKIH
jgi:hypothetical protein